MNTTDVARTTALVALGALVACAGLVVSAAPLDRTVAIVAQADGTFDPPEFWVDPGDALRIEFTNGDLFNAHDLVFELDGGRVVRTEEIPFPGSRTLAFAAPTTLGDYPYYCTRHRAQGMKGKLHVGPRPTATLPPSATPTATRAPDVPYETVIDDLQNPDGLALSPDEVLGASVLIAEGGTGGDPPYPGAPRPGNGDGRVLNVAVDMPELRDVLLEGVTNAQSPAGGVFGANHAQWWTMDEPASGTAVVALVAVAGGAGHARPDEGAKIVAVGEEGERRIVADTLAYEQAHNPDRGDPSAGGVASDPRRLVPDPIGRYVYVVDTAANDILKLDPATGELSTFAVFDPIGPDRSPAMPADMVIVHFRVARVALVGAFVSLRAGDVPGAGQIRFVVDINSDGDVLDDGEREVWVVEGLTSPGDVAWAGEASSPEGLGHLYVAETGLDRITMLPGIVCSAIVWYDLVPTPEPGATPTGTLVAPPDRPGPVTVATALYGVRGLALDTDGDMYASVFGWSRGGHVGAPTDRVVRIPAERLAPPATPTPTVVGASPTVRTPPPDATPMATSVTAAPPGRDIFLPAAVRRPALGR